MRESNLPRRQYIDELKIEAVRLAESIGGREAARRLGESVATVGNWKRRRTAAGLLGIAAIEVVPSAATALQPRPVNELEAENSRLRRGLADAQLDVEVLHKSDGIHCQRVAMEYAWIQNHHDQYTVSWLCRVLSVLRSGHCQWRIRPPSARTLANQILDAQVSDIHRGSHRSYGRPRIVQQQQQGEA